MKDRSNTIKLLIYLSWATAIIATLGSLYFSEIAGYAPCILCWYQRIGMYPLVFLYPVGILNRDRMVAWYALPLVVIGWCIALFQNLLYWKIIPEAAAPCKVGVSCTTHYIDYLHGFVTIPSLSWLAFTFILICMITVIRLNKKDDQWNEDCNVSRCFGGSVN